MILRLMGAMDNDNRCAEMDRIPRIRLLRGGIPWQSNYHSLCYVLSVYPENSCGHAATISFRHSCQEKTCSAKYRELTYESHKFF